MWIHVDGNEGVTLQLYALSTCGWCKKTKDLLNEHGVAYDYVFVDNLDSSDQEKALEEMVSYVSEQAFPLLVIDGKDSIQGYKPEKIEEIIKGK
ncbi:glutaredoxin family protein [Clostridia bacterium]|nr:glutaredoxin family protein [Clostridia bacterium]